MDCIQDKYLAEFVGTFAIGFSFAAGAVCAIIDIYI